MYDSLDDISWLLITKTKFGTTLGHSLGGTRYFIITALLGNALFAVLKSKFLVISLIVTSTLLFLDAWFDVASARAGRPLIVAISEALIFELPLALISFSVAWNLITNLDFKSRL